jgi:hypothetical protein
VTLHFRVVGAVVGGAESGGLTVESVEQCMKPVSVRGVSTRVMLARTSL